MNSVKIIKNDKEIVIQVVGDFTYDLHREMRAAYRDELPNTAFVVDLAKTQNMDSSALGMLLLLREFAGGDNAHVKVINASTKLREILKIVRFEQLFEMG